jgi:hypothetical protein
MRILYITLFADPINLVPTLRTNAFMNYLPEFGVEIDVLTRYYDENARSINDFNITFSKIEDKISLPFKKGNIVYAGFSQNEKEINRFQKLPFGLNILYSYKKKDIYHAGWTSHAINAYEQLLEKNHYDYIVASYSPVITLQIASLLSKKYQIPWIAEFRDPYTDSSLESRKASLIKIAIVNSILKSSSGVISVCEPVNEIVTNNGTSYIRNLPKTVVNNGVDAMVEEKMDLKDLSVYDEILKLKNDHFVLLHTGTIYPGQNIKFFIDFIEKFNANHPNKPLLLVCVGLNEKELDKNILASPGIRILKKVNLSSSLYIQKFADALVLPTWLIKVYSGFAAKIFEYIHSGNQVLCSPGPTKDLEEFLVHFDNVFIASDFRSIELHVLILIEQKSSRLIEKNMAPMLFRKYWIEKMAIFLKLLSKNKRKKAVLD